jgi:hypothetical protein
MTTKLALRKLDLQQAGVLPESRKKLAAPASFFAEITAALAGALTTLITAAHGATAALQLPYTQVDSAGIARLIGGAPQQSVADADLFFIRLGRFLDTVDAGGLLAEGEGDTIFHVGAPDASGNRVAGLMAA